MAGTQSITKKGQYILDCLEENSSRHLTAEELSDILKKRDLDISTATIYRQLEKLTVAGRVRKYTSSSDEPACYQINTGKNECARHFHLKCTRCNKLIHLSCEYLDRLESHIQEHHGFEVDNTRTVLYGLCKNCRK